MSVPLNIAIQGIVFNDLGSIATQGFFVVGGGIAKKHKHVINGKTHYVTDYEAQRLIQKEQRRLKKQARKENIEEVVETAKFTPQPYTRQKIKLVAIPNLGINIPNDRIKALDTIALQTSLAFQKMEAERLMEEQDEEDLMYLLINYFL